MTTNAVNYKLGMDSNAIKRAETTIKKLEAELKSKGLELDRDKLLEAIRTNKVNEYLREAELDEKKWKNEQDVWLNIAKIFMGGGVEGGKLLANDESWHNKLIDTYDQATKLSFSLRGGQPITVGSSTSETAATNVRPVATDFQGTSGINVANGGIALIKYYPVFSIQSQNCEAGETQNVVRTIWNRVRSSNSGYINGYDQSDLFQYVFCSSALAEVLATILRPFNYMDAKRKPINNYMTTDRIILDALTGGRGSQVITNKTGFIQIINSKLRAVNAQKLPIGFDLTKRRLVLNRNIFTHDKNKDELYIFLPSITYVYDEANGKCTAKAIDYYNDVFASPEKMGLFLESLISPLINGNASSIMAGDIGKAYPKKVNTLQSLKYTLKGDVYSSDEHILESIRNCNIVPTQEGNDVSAFDVKQGLNAYNDTYIYTGDLYGGRMQFNFTEKYTTDSDLVDAYAYHFNITPDVPQRKFYCTNILDVKSDKPLPYDIMAGTRFKVNRAVTIRGGQVAGDDAIFSKTAVTGCGTEMIHEIELRFFSNPSNFLNQSLTSVSLNQAEGWDFFNVTIVDRIQELKNALNFRYAPYIPNFAFYDYGTNRYEYVIGRGNYNMRNITEWELDQLNIASFGSLLLTEDDKINNKDLE